MTSLTKEPDDADPPHVVLDPFAEADAYPGVTLRRSWADIDGSTNLIVVFSDLTVIDDDQLATLLNGIRRFREGGMTLVAVATNPSLTRLLETTGFDRIVPVADSYAAALQVLRGS